MHQWRAFKNKKNILVDPRKKHTLDLISLIHEDQRKGDLSLIMGDFNEDFEDSEQEGIHLLTSTYRIVHTYLHLLGHIPSSRVNNRSVYHTYCSPELIPFITNIKVCQEHVGFSTSDHIPFYIDIQNTILHTSISPIQHIDNRILRMYDTVKTNQYIAYVEKQLIYHNIPNRLENLNSTYYRMVSPKLVQVY